jgi:hypothetical protein
MAGGVVCCKALAACDPRERSLQLQPPWTLQRSGRRAEQPVAARFVDCGCYTTHSAWEGRASAPSLAAGHSVRGPSSVGRSGACVQVWQSCASAGEERASARSRRRSRMTGESSGAFVVPNAALPTSGSPARPSRARRSLTPPAARRPARRRPTASYRTSYDKKMSSEKAFVRRTPPRPAHPRRRPTAKIYCRKKFIRPPDRTRGPPPRRPRAARPADARPDGVVGRRRIGVVRRTVRAELRQKNEERQTHATQHSPAETLSTNYRMRGTRSLRSSAARYKQVTTPTVRDVTTTQQYMYATRVMYAVHSPIRGRGGRERAPAAAS